jgi:hypothetical protein
MRMRAVPHHTIPRSSLVWEWGWGKVPTAFVLGGRASHDDVSVLMVIRSSSISYLFVCWQSLWYRDLTFTSVRICLSRTSDWEHDMSSCP